MAQKDGLINSFIQHAANVGFAKSNRFIVLVRGPGINATISDNTAPKNSILNFNDINIGSREQERLALACQTATIPSKALMTQEFNPVGNGPPTHHAYAENVSGELTLEFLTSSDFFERMYFESWIDKIVDPGTHEVAMYEEYAKKYSIVVAYLPPDLDKIGSTRDRQYGNYGGVDFNSIYRSIGNASGGRSDIYFAHFHHVYPIRVNEQALAMGTGDVLKVSVTFKYNRWSDPVLDYENRRRFVRQQIKNIQQFNVQEKDVTRDISSTRARDTNRRIQDGLDVSRNGVRTESETFRGTLPIDDPNTQVGLMEEKMSPFEKFKKIARTVAKYSNPQELKGLLINEGLGAINSVIGEGTVESLASAGQIVDVYARTSNKNIQNTSNKLIGPLGNLLR